MPAAADRYLVRAAEPRDVEALVGLIGELAAFERLGHLVETTPEKLRRHLFGERPVVEALVAEPLAEATSTFDADRATARGQAPRAVVAGPAVQASAAGAGGGPVAFALYFTNFSTFLARPGLYLEDLYVRPPHRGAGLGRRLLERLAAIAVEREYGRFEWSVLDWNAGAIGFYERMGATVMPDWRICRVTGEALRALGAVR